MSAESQAEARPVARKWFWLSAGLNVLLLILAGGVALFALMLSYDLQDARVQLDKERQARQRAEDYLAESRARAAEVEREIQRLSRALTEKVIDPAQIEDDKPPLPVAIRFRKSWLGIGLVAVMENTSSQHLTMILTTRNPTLAKAQRFQIEIKPGGDIAFGHDDGWKFASGDELALYHNGYRAVRVLVP